MSEREEHRYEIKKGDVELKTSDKELAYRFLGIEEVVRTPMAPISLVYKREGREKPKQTIRETENCYVIGDSGSVSKDCVSDVHNAVIRNSVGKQYVMRKEIDADEAMKKWSATYKSRALSVLAEKGKIKRWRLSGKRNKYGYSPITPFEKPPAVKVVDEKTKEMIRASVKEVRTQADVLREGQK